MTRRFGRKPLYDQVQDNIRALRFYGATDEQIAGMQKYVPPPPKKRAPRTEDPQRPLERDILKAVLETLRVHPQVAFAIRQTTGTFLDGQRYIKVGTPGLPDILFMLKGGRLGMIEVKRPGEKPKPPQQVWLDLIAASGGISGVARSVEDAIAIIEGTTR